MKFVIDERVHLTLDGQNVFFPVGLVLNVS